jgi:hypothetical protein
MGIEKTVIDTDNGNKKLPKFQEILETKFKTWTGINDPDLSEALKDLCGDSFFEMRKMTAQICRAIEGEVLDKEKAKVLTNALKLIIDDTWRSIIDKQKVGVDKLGILVHKYAKDI